MSTPIALGILGAGLVLMVSAFRNESPIDVVLIALGRGPSSPAKFGAGGATLGLGKGSTPAPSSPPSGGGVVPGAGGGGGGGSW